MANARRRFTPASSSSTSSHSMRPDQEGFAELEKRMDDMKMRDRYAPPHPKFTNVGRKTQLTPPLPLLLPRSPSPSHSLREPDTCRTVLGFLAKLKMQADVMFGIYLLSPLERLVIWATIIIICFAFNHTLYTKWSEIKALSYSLFSSTS